MQISKEEAIALARVTSMLTGNLNNLEQMTTGSSRNLTGADGIDVNTILNQFTIAQPPKPEGPVIEGVNLQDRYDNEIVLHPVDEQVVKKIESTDSIMPNPFASQFKKALTKEVPVTQSPSIEETSSVVQSELAKMDTNIAKTIIEKLISIEIRVSKLQSAIKKLNINESKSPKG